MESLKIKILDPKVKHLLDDLESLRLIKLEITDASAKPKRRFGSMKGLVVDIAEDFDAPLEDEKENV